MRTSSLLLTLVLTSIPTILRAQPVVDAGLPGGPLLSRSAEPTATQPVAKHLGTFALRGHVFDGQKPFRLATARLEISRATDGALTVIRHGAVTLAPRAARRTTWTAAPSDVQVMGDRLIVTYRPIDGWVDGLTGALDGSGRSVEHQNQLDATYTFTDEGVVEDMFNNTGLAPEHFWSESRLLGRRLRASDLQVGPTVTTLVDHGPSAARYDLVIVSDGYTPEELPAFRADARAVIEQLRATSPFTEYWGYLNVHRVEVVSAGGGIPGGRGGPAVLGTHLDGGPNEIPSGSRSKVFEAVKRAPGADVVVVLVNDMFRSVAHVGFTFVSAFDHDLAHVAVHELGHSLGFLFDEYEEFPSSRWDFVFANGWVDGFTKWGGWGANLTTRTGRDDVPWRDWIPMGTVPLPTPDGSGHAIGLYEGGMQRQRGWYRPSESCLMRDHSVPFCAVCREAIVLRLSQRTRPFEVKLTRVDQDTVRLAIESRIPGPVRVTWLRNGFEVMQGPTAVMLTRDNQPWGTSDLEVVIEDATPFVRNDPNEWTVFRVRFELEKGQVWTKGLKVRGPYYAAPRELGGEDVFRKFDRG